MFVVYPTVAEGDHELGGGVDPAQDRVDRDALPAGAELGPLGDAVDVDRDLLGRQRAELLPSPPGDDGPGLVNDREIPVLQRDVGRRPCAQHREVIHEVLTRRHQPGAGLTPTTLEPTTDDRHALLLSQNDTPQPTASPRPQQWTNPTTRPCS